MLIPGTQLAQELVEQLKNERRQFGPLRLAAIQVGENPASLSFLKQKERIAKDLEIDFRLYQYPETLSRKQLREKIGQIVAATTTTTALIQLPLPEKFPAQYFLNAVPPEKDTECLCSRSLGKFIVGQSPILPPSVEVVKFLLNTYKVDLKRGTAVVAGYGRLIGKPISIWLAQQEATVATLNEQTDNPERFFQMADILVSGAGVPHLVKTAKKNSFVIDFGYGLLENRIVGDVDVEKIEDVAANVTPTPGGTGPLLVAMLFKNLLTLAQERKQRNTKA